MEILRKTLVIILGLALISFAVFSSVYVALTLEDKKIAFNTWRRAELYGYNDIGDCLYQDENGHQWLIRGTNVKNIRIEVSPGAKYRDSSDDYILSVWVEVDTETEN